MPEVSWVMIAEEKELAEGIPKASFPKGLPVLLLKVDGGVYAMSNKCAHMGCLLSSGKVDGFVISCPCHAWRFDVRTGTFLDANEISVPTYRCKLENGKVSVLI